MYKLQSKIFKNCFIIQKLSFITWTRHNKQFSNPLSRCNRLRNSEGNSKMEEKLKREYVNISERIHFKEGRYKNKDSNKKQNKPMLMSCNVVA